MVLSPIEPVAPSTLTERTAEIAALLLRKGTALMSSPNHKTAADAIHAAPQNAEYRRHDDRCDKSLEPIQQPAMAGDDLARILDAEAPLYRGFEEIAKLRDDREERGDEQQRPGFAEAKRGKAHGDDKACRKAADGARPGLLRADARPQFWSADAAAGKVAADIGDPHHQQHEHQSDEAAA